MPVTSNLLRCIASHLTTQPPMSSVDIDMPLHAIKACTKSTMEAPSSIPQLVIELTIEYIRVIQVTFIDETTRLGSSGIEPFKWRSVLSRLCLVQKSWRIPAQRNLQKRVVMQTNNQIFSAIPLQVFFPWTLDYLPSQGGTSETTKIRGHPKNWTSTAHPDIPASLSFFELAIPLHLEWQFHRR